MVSKFNRISKTNAMQIPLNIKGREDLCLSFIRMADGSYSVAVNEVVNGFGMDPIPSYLVLEGDSEEVSPVPMIIHDLGTTTSLDPLEAIHEMLERLMTAEL